MIEAGKVQIVHQRHKDVLKKEKKQTKDTDRLAADFLAAWTAHDRVISSKYSEKITVNLQLYTQLNYFLRLIIK